MEIYEHIASLLAAVTGFIDGGTIARLLQEGPAQVSRFWETNTQVATAISTAQVVAALVSAVFAFVIMVAILKKQALVAAPVAEPTQPAEDVGASVPVVAQPGVLRARWDEVLRRLESTTEAEWKVAVVEADKLVDSALARAGFPGDSFGDRLVGIQPGTLLSLDGLWWAHKVRNRLAHELDYFLRYTEARQAISYYEQVLAELQLI